MRSMKKGEVIKCEDVGVLRTEKNLTPEIGPEYLELVLGKILAKDVEDGEGLVFEHLMKKLNLNLY